MNAGEIEATDDAVRLHWPEYSIEAALLGAFMASACLVTALLEHPGSPVNVALPDPLSRRALIGLAMGATAIALIYSPWGRRSGAHFNPSVTLTYLRLGKIERRDALGYALAQCAGGAAGVLVASLVLGRVVAGHPAVAYAATLPGTGGAALAFAAEVAISFVLMSLVLWISNGAHARLTGLACGALVAMNITFEAPLSGMSMNPARSLASALFDGRWSHLWIYLVAPPLGMLGAAELYRSRRAFRVLCAKLHHDPAKRCIFRCGHAALEET
jgi:aquaporin Z